MPQTTTNLGLPLWGETPPEGATGLTLRNAILGENEDSMAQLLDTKVERLANKVSDISDESTDEQYPSALAVKNYVDNKPSVSSWNDLTDKPFGEEAAETTETVILAETTLEGFEYNSTLGAFRYRGTDLVQASYTLKADKEYTIVWDSDSFTRTAFAFTFADGSECVGIGNTLATGGSDSGEPFCIVYDKTNAQLHYLSIEQDTSHTVSVVTTIIGTTETQLDSKYMSILTPTAIDIMSEQTISFTITRVSTDSEMYVAVTQEELFGELFDMLSFIEPDQLYQIVWNGAEYSCVAQDISDMESSWGVVNKFIRLGNWYIANYDPANDTGEPFCIVVADVVDNNGTSSRFGQIKTFPTFEEIENELTNSSCHCDRTICIRRFDNKLDEKYLPDTLVTDTELNEAIANINSLDVEGRAYGIVGRESSSSWSKYTYSVTGTQMSQMVKRGTYTDLLERPFGEIPAIFVCSDDVLDIQLHLVGTDQIFDAFGFDTSIAPLCRSAWIENVPAPVMGESYIFNLGNAAYPCAAKRVYDIDESLNIEDNRESYYFGNFGLTGLQSTGIGEDTGEPFLILWEQGNCTVYVTVEHTATLPDGYEKTASLVPVNEYFKIDEKYLPEISTGVSSWNDLTDKPFGEVATETDILAETTITEFALSDTGGYYAFGDISYELTVGETYAVYWDGETYKCVAQDASFLAEGFVGLGNLSLVGLLGNDEPFIILSEITSMPIYTSLTDTEAGGSHTVRICHVEETKLDNKYLSILNHTPAGTVEVDLLPEVTYSNFALHPTFGVYGVNRKVAYTVTVGEVYMVEWDGELYECVAEDSSAVVPGSICIGNGAGFGLSGNNEPFAIAVFNEDGASMVASLTDTEAGGSHTVRIYQVEVNEEETKLDNKYLSILNHTPSGTAEVDLLPEVTYSNFALHPTFGVYGVNRKVAYTVTVGEVYMVEWDGELYECVAEDSSAVVPGSICIGNGAGFGLSGNNEPFAIAVFNEDGASMVASLTDTEAGGSHTVRIYQVHTTEERCKLKAGIASWNDLADKPFGEITAGALVLDETVATGTVVSDGTADAASLTGLNASYIVEDANYIVAINGVKYTGIGAVNNGMKGIMITDTSGTQVGAAVANFEGGGDVFITMPSIIPTNSEVDVKITLAESIVATLDSKYLPSDLGGSSLPEVTTDDNNKVLTVVDGAWTAQTLAEGPKELPEVTSSDHGKVLAVNSGEWAAMTLAKELPVVTTADNNKVLTVSNGVWSAQTPASGLPEVTASDAGKFLRVSSSGAWAVESVPNAEEASF